eukprot:scaffold1268_cov387-Pavlova_lutheri.AAC.2
MEAVSSSLGWRTSRWRERRPSPSWLGGASSGTWRDLERCFSGAESADGSRKSVGEAPWTSWGQASSHPLHAREVPLRASP